MASSDEITVMKKFSILDENFFLIEGQIVSSFRNAGFLMEDCDCQKFEDISSEGDLKTDPAYLNHRAELNPLKVSSDCCDLIKSRIGGDKEEFRNLPLDKATKIIVIFGKIDPSWKVNNDSAIDDVMGFFGGPDACSYDSGSKMISLNDIGANNFRDKLGAIRELASKLPGEISKCVSSNDRDGLKNNLGKVILIKKVSEVI